MGFIFQGCGKSGSGSSSDIKSHVKTSFDAVTSKLDSGGNLYIYADTTRIMKTVDKFISSIRNIAEKSSGQTPESMAESLKGIDFLIGLFKRSGISEIDGFGISSVSIAENLNHSKVVMHHAKGKGTGFLWELAGKGSGKLDHLNMLPANTVMARFGEFHAKKFWELIKKEAAASGIPELQQGINSIEPALQQHGVDFNKILGSLSGSIGFLITLDSGNMKKIPMDGVEIDIPDPAFAVVIDVADDSLFHMITKDAPPKAVTEEGGMKRLKMPMPPMPITLAPELVQAKGHMIFASNPKIIDDMFAAKANGNGLTSGEEFKRMSQHIPAEGKGFSFIGSALLDNVRRIIETGVKESMKHRSEDQTGPSPEEAMKPMLDLMPDTFSLYGVMQHTDEGMIMTVNHTTGIEHLLLIPAVTSIGIVAAIAIPNMLMYQKSRHESMEMAPHQMDTQPQAEASDSTQLEEGTNDN
jgi:hypothetical protein